MHRSFSRTPLVLLLVAVACGHGGAGTQSSGPTTTTSTLPDTSITGGTPAQQTAVRNIVDGLGPANGISQIRIASSGPDAFATQADSWLQFSIPTGRGPGTIKAQWMAFLVAGSFRDESAQSTALPAVGGAILRGYGAQLIGGSDHPPITVTAPIDQIIASRLTAIGLTSTSITDAKPELGVAPIVITQTSDPASFVAAHPEPWGEVFGDLNTYEGTYLEVDDTTGSPVIVGAYASRAAHGVEWVRPGLRSFTMGGLHTTGPDSSPQ